ncbi:MAG: hypothetical protein AB8H80_10005 [Planctomycetota bacterium]
MSDDAPFDAADGPQPPADAVAAAGGGSRNLDDAGPEEASPGQASRGIGDPGEEGRRPSPVRTGATRWSGADFLLLGAITIVASALRLFRIEQWSFDGTEADTWRALTQPLGAGPDGFFASMQAWFPAGYLPLRWLVEAGWLQGVTEGWLRLPFAFVGALTIPMFALFARPLVGRGPARLAAMVLAVHPAHIGISQTADPLVLALPLGMLAGVAARRPGGGGASDDSPLGLRQFVAWLLPWLCVLAASAAHPIGLCLGVACMAVARDPALGGSEGQGERDAFVEPPGWWQDRRLWWPVVAVLAALSGAFLMPELLVLMGAPVVVLAVACGLGRVHERSFRLSFAATLLMLLGAAFCATGFAVAERAALLAALPLAILLASAAARAIYRRVRESFAAQPRTAVLLGASPALILLGALMTVSFLHFAVYEGDRAPWRSVRDAIAQDRVAGRPVRVFAMSGVDVLRTYLRPNHWRRPGHDAHPGVLVAPVSRGVAELREQLAVPGTMVVLLHDEREALERDAEMAELLRDLVVARHWTRPRPYGDASLYLLMRPTSD